MLSNRGSGRGEGGQTTLEYLLLMGVVVVILSGVMPIVRKGLMGEDGTCANPSSEALLCRLVAKMGLDRGVRATYRYFPLL